MPSRGPVVLDHGKPEEGTHNLAHLHLVSHSCPRLNPRVKQQRAEFQL